MDEMLKRFRAQGSKGLGMALAEYVAALNRLGHYCFTRSSRVLPSERKRGKEGAVITPHNMVHGAPLGLHVYRHQKGYEGTVARWVGGSDAVKWD